MVRVVSCHHFVSQDVFLSEQEPLAHCSAQEKFLVATAQNFVNVHNLDSRGKILHTFPTVDIVTHIIYCESGNYVATIEKKITRHSNAITCVRIYFNWWIDAQGQPLKVRVSGCPPASIDRQPWNNQFEIVELPLEGPAISIACCRKTSSLAVSLGKVISVFHYTAKTHEFFQKFGDFEHLMNIKMYFTVKELSICENYFACMSDKIIQVIKIVVEKDEEAVSETIPDLETITNSNELYSDDFVEWRFESCMTDGSSDISWEKHLKSKLHSNSFPITISLPTIDRENEKFSNSGTSELHGPLLTVKGCTINVKFNVKVFEMFPSLSGNVRAVTLLYKQFSSVDGSSCDLMKHQLVPFYSCELQLKGPSDPLSSAVVESERMLFSLPWLNLNTDEVSHLKAMGCFFTTCQEGFLYDISHKTKLITRYAYTASLKGVALESTLLHALTETGLETYTMHLPHSALQHIESADGVKNIVPNFEDAVCLLGLRPFLGVDHLAISDNHIILVSSTEDSVANNDTNESNSCTLYSLKKPPPSQVFCDLLEMAELHQSSSPTTYYHLLSESHVILRTHLFLNNIQNDEVNALYVKSCLLIADYFISSDASEKSQAVPYYHLSKLPPNNIVQRISDFHSKVKPASVSKSLVHYLNSVLFDDDNKFISEISQPCAEIILSAYSEEAPDSLWKVILCSKLNGYKYDRAILMLKRRLTSKRHPLSPISNATDTLALVSLLLKKLNTEAAQNMLLSLAKVELVTVLKSVHNTLWSGINFTILGKFLKQVRPDAFVELLLTMIDNNNMKVSDIILMLKNDSPHSDLHSVPLLKEFLEASLSDKKSPSNSDNAGSNLLVKIYMKRLLEANERAVPSSSPFSGNVCAFTLLFGSRPSWLNEMPPFNGNGVSRSCLKNFKDSDKTVNDFSLDCCCWSCNEDLLRLQSLLSYLGPSDIIKEHVLEFLCSANEKNTKWISLEVMCSNETQAIKILIESAPKALLPYAKENFNLQQNKWTILFSLLHEHMKILPEDHPHSNIYSLTFNGVLSHLSETLKPVEFLGLLPTGEDPTFLPHVQRCVEKHQADQLRTKIVSLGQEIKSMM